MQIYLVVLVLCLGASCAHQSKEDDEYLLRPARPTWGHNGSSHSNPPISESASNDLRQSVRYTTLSQNIRFDYASAAITPSTAKALDTIAQEINKSAGSFQKIRLSGLTDASGNSDRNQRLSMQRAENVRRYLISRGVPPEKIEAVGRGAADSNIMGTQIKSAADRRVDFEIIR
jgi:outer membrane protein OmpA-like peptidoglycan-associated protein